MGAGMPITYDDEWIVDNWMAYRNWSKLCKAYNDTHGTNLNYNTFKSHCNRTLSLNYHYSTEQLVWLRENYPQYGRTCTEEFNRIFHENRSAQAIKNQCLRMGIHVTTERRKKTAIENTGRWHPVGTIIRRMHDEPYIKTENGWKRLKDINYGDKPEGHIIIHLDGNVDNYDKSNLLAIPRNVNAKMTLNRFWSQFPEVTKAGVLCCELELLSAKP